MNNFSTASFLYSFRLQHKMRMCYVHVRHVLFLNAHLITSEFVTAPKNITKYERTKPQKIILLTKIP